MSWKQSRREIFTIYLSDHIFFLQNLYIFLWCFQKQVLRQIWPICSSYRRQSIGLRFKFSSSWKEKGLHSLSKILNSVLVKTNKQTKTWDISKCSEKWNISIDDRKQNTRLQLYNQPTVPHVAEYQSFWLSHSSFIYSITIC